MVPDNQPQRQQIRVSRPWLDLLKRLPARPGRLVVMGGVDSGKTTFCRWLLSKLPAEARPALVDSDPGQSTIGPPSCLGWRFAGTTACEFVFVGDTTPASNPAATLAGTVKMVRAAEAAGAGFVVVDTSGYVAGRGGYELKSAKLELLAPVQAILLGDSPPLKRLHAAWHGDERVQVHCLPQSEVLTQKSREARAQWRRERFAEALQGAELRKISLRGKRLGGLSTAAELRAEGHEPGELQDLLLCFHDQERRGVCLGLLQTLDLRAQELLVRAPAAAEQAAGIMFGTLRLTADGQEIARLA